MTDTPEPPRTPLQETALELAGILGGFDKAGDPLLAVESQLTPRQRALLRDAFGLLAGIGGGTITLGQPRIRDNLVEVLADLPSQLDADHICTIASLLESVLSRAAGSGLTAEGQKFENKRFVDKVRS